MIYAIILSVTSANILERMRVLGTDFRPLGAVVLALTWTDCGGLSKVTSLEPSTLTLGATTTVTGHGNMPMEVTGGSYNIKMNAGGFINENWNGDICQAKTFDLPLGMGSVKFNGMPCPIAKGAEALSMDIQMSGLIPTSMASATIKVTATDSSGQELLCLNLNTKPQGAALASAANACMDSADQAIWTKDGSADFASDLSACGHQCLGDAGCTSKCIEKRRGYTAACSGCFGTLTGCTKDNCMFDCMLSATGSSCKNCVDKDCTPAFETCSGLTPPSQAE